MQVGICLDFATLILEFLLNSLPSRLQHAIGVQMAGSARNAACAVEPGEKPKAAVPVHGHYNKFAYKTRNHN